MAEMMEFFGFNNKDGSGLSPHTNTNRAALKLVVEAREKKEAQDGSPFNSLTEVGYELNT